MTLSLQTSTKTVVEAGAVRLTCQAKNLEAQHRLSIFYCDKLAATMSTEEMTRAQVASAQAIAGSVARLRENRSPYLSLAVSI